MTRRRVGSVLLLVLLAVLGYMLWLQTSVRMGGAPASLRGSAGSEEEWIVESIVSDLARMALAASGMRGPELDDVGVELDGAGADWRARIRLPGRDAALDEELTLVPYPWNPDAYVDLARDVLKTIPTALELPDRDLPDRLLASTTETLVDEDLRLSDALSVEPASRSAHEEAALLLAALAFRESAGEFSDLRHLFSRMTAHLAIAASLSGTTGAVETDAGRVARAALLALTGREQEAVDATAIVHNPGWHRMLQMRVTDDWRALPNPGQATNLEKLEWFRAMARTTDTASAMQRYQDAFPDENPGLDWFHVAIENYEGPSDGYYFRGRLLDLELDALRAVRRRYGDSILAVDLSLNEAPRGLYGPKGEGPGVAGWSYWAGFYQRHLCDHLVKADTYYRVGLGIDEDADRYLAVADPQLGRMLLYPFVRMRRTARRGVQVEDIESMGGVVRTTVNNPERVTTANWYFAAWTTRQMAMRRGMPLAAPWFSSRLATESSFDVRMRLIALKRQRSAEDIEALHRIAPRNIEVLRFLLERPKDEAMPVGELLALLGPRSEYDLRALHLAESYADHSHQDELPFRQRMCAIDPSACVSLGRLLAARHDEQGAVRAYRRAFDEASDRVQISNQMAWLVHYYQAHANTKEALTVAREGAETGSSAGMTTLAKLLEDLDELEEAERLFQRNRERYDAPGPLIAFYFRLGRVRGLGAYQQKLASAVEEVFPGGLRDYFESDNETPPRDGVLINSNSRRLRRSGLLPGDIVVALDGFRVRNWDQYQAVRDFTSSPDMRFVVWRVNRYLSVETSAPQRRFGVDMMDYRPRVSIDSMMK